MEIAPEHPWHRAPTGPGTRKSAPHGCKGPAGRRPTGSNMQPTAQQTPKGQTQASQASLPARQSQLCCPLLSQAVCRLLILHCGCQVGQTSLLLLRPWMQGPGCKVLGWFFSRSSGSASPTSRFLSSTPVLFHQEASLIYYSPVFRTPSRSLFPSSHVYVHCTTSSSTLLLTLF
jgi:hypothetical protein